MQSSTPLGPYPVAHHRPARALGGRGARSRVPGAAADAAAGRGADSMAGWRTVTLCGGARTGPPPRAGAARSAALARSAHPDPVRQRHRARAAGAGRDVRRRALRADRAGLLAAGAASSARSGRSSTGCSPGSCSPPRAPLFERALTDALPPGRRARRVDVGARRRCRRRRSRTSQATPRRRAVDAARDRVGPRHDRQGAVHVGVDRPAEGRHQHAADAVLEPGDDPLGAAVPRRRAAGAVRLAAVEPHRRRQPQLRPRALQRRHALHRRGQADAARSSAPRCAICARSPATAHFTVPRTYEMLLPHLRSDAVLRETFFRELKLSSTRRPAWASASGTSCATWPSRRAARSC